MMEVHMRKLLFLAAMTLGAHVAGAQRVRFNGTSSPSPFWRDLGDSTLTRLVEDALQANVDVHIAEARLTGTRAARRLAALDLAPTITATGSMAQQQLSIAQIPGLTRQLPQQQLWDAGFDASWELDVFGRVTRNVRAQGALVESAERGLEDVQVSLAAEVARTYFELRGAQQQLAVALRNAENQRRTVKITEDRLAAGRGTAFDTERGRSELYLTLAATPLLETQIAAHRQRIATLLGRPASELPRALSDSAALPHLPDTLRIGSADELVKRRPDVLSAERRAAAQELFVGAAKSEYLPRLTLGAHVGYAATRFDSLGRLGTSRLLVGPVLSWPLLDLGRVRERVDFAEAEHLAARAEQTATILRAVEETESARVTYDRAHARLAILDQAVQSSGRAAALAQQRFEAGLTDFLQVLDAQRTLLDAENQLALGRTAAATALIAVYKAVGGTWPARSFDDVHK
jgi:multidrug efflux system outer membrane protein